MRLAKLKLKLSKKAIESAGFIAAWLAIVAFLLVLLEWRYSW